MESIFDMFTFEKNIVSPISQLSHKVKSPRKTKLWGLFLLMEETQARAMIKMKEEAMAT